MKHAINELKALLDTWGPQKEPGWNDHMKKAIVVLENISETTMVMLEPKGIRLENISELKVRPPIIYPAGNITEWHNDPEVSVETYEGRTISSSSVAEKDHDQALQEEYEGTVLDPITMDRRPMTQDEIARAWADATGVPVVDDKGDVVYNPEVPLRFNTVEELKDHVASMEDDDLGELDPSKACGFGEEGCSSCQ